MPLMVSDVVSGKERVSAVKECALMPTDVRSEWSRRSVISLILIEQRRLIVMSWKPWNGSLLDL